MKRRDALKHTALLGGAIVFSGSLLTMLQSCQQQSRLDWQPKFLSVDHARLTSALVDTILPTTDTPGGLDVKVDMMIDLILAETVDEAGQKGMMAEMDAFNEACKAKLGKVFADLNAEERNSILQEEEANSPKFSPGVWGGAVGEQVPVGFYRSFKALAVNMYFTSEEIGKNVMKYDPVPGPFQGCIPFDDVGGTWSY